MRIHLSDSRERRDFSPALRRAVTRDPTSASSSQHLTSHSPKRALPTAHQHHSPRDLSHSRCIPRTNFTTFAWCRELS
jgi:hypothetical protein